MIACIYAVSVNSLILTYENKYWESSYGSHEENKTKGTILRIFLNPFFNIGLTIFANWCINMYLNPSNVNGTQIGLWSPATGGSISLGQALRDAVYVMYKKHISISSLLLFLSDN